VHTDKLAVDEVGVGLDVAKAEIDGVEQRNTVLLVIVG